MTAAGRIALACLTAVLALLCGSVAPATAQFQTRLIVKVTPSPDQAASGGPVAFTVTVRADGSVKADNVVVTMAVPAGTAFAKCTMVVTEGADSTPCTPGLANGVVTARFGRVAAWKTSRVTLTLTMPTVATPTQVTLTAHADSDTATDAGSYDTNNAEHNDGGGFLITGSNNTLKSNNAEDNSGVGFKVTGTATANRFNTNAASLNEIKQWDVKSGQIDDGGNKSSGSPFPIPPGGGTSNN